MARLQPYNNFVPPKEGTANLLVVGEAPGQEENDQMEPFVGKSGMMLDGWFHKVGVSRHSLNMTNVLSCRPKNNYFPTDFKARSYITAEQGREAVEHCWQHHLLPFLQSKNWDKVYLIGGKALKRVTGKDSLFEWGGTPLPIPVLDPARRVAIATLHPAGLMRDPSMFPLVFSDLKRPLEPPPEHYQVNPHYSVVEQFAGRPFVVDIETDVPPTKVRMFSLSNSAYRAIAAPYGGVYAQALAHLLSQATEVVGQNCLQFDLPMLSKHGAPTSLDPDQLQVWDTMLMHHLIWPTLPHDLGTIARQYIHKPYWKDWVGSGDEEAVYACRDADGTGQIYIPLRRELEREPRLLALYKEVQVPLARICHQMTEIGIMTDPASAQRMHDRADAIIAEQEQHLPDHMRPRLLTKRKRITAPPGTLSPPKYGKKGQLLKQKPVKFLYEEVQKMGPAPWRNGPRTAKFLYEELGLKTRFDAEGRITTGKKALTILFVNLEKDEKLRHLAPVVGAIRELRRWVHRQTICKKLMTGKAKRIHASFNVHGTNTGRLSSTGGDEKLQLQNVTEEMRVVFVPSRPGWRLGAVDFSQMEARIAAWFAKDTERAARFDIPGYNEYKHAASIFLGISADDVIKEKSPDSPYHKAKTIVLGTDRALGSRKISLDNDIPEAEVKEMQRQWKSQIPKTMAWQAEIGAQAKRDKVLWNPFGRRGRFYGGKEYTEGISYLPQSTGGDVVFRCMIALMHERIEWPRSWADRIVRVVLPLPSPARLLLQVHDELVFEYPAEMENEVRDITTCVMSQPWPELDELALPVNFSSGENWFEMVEATP